MSVVLSNRHQKYQPTPKTISSTRKLKQAGAAAKKNVKHGWVRWPKNQNHARAGAAVENISFSSLMASHPHVFFLKNLPLGFFISFLIHDKAPWSIRSKHRLQA
jgi:hypothetical protein